MPVFQRPGAPGAVDRPAHRLVGGERARLVLRARHPARSREQHRFPAADGSKWDFYGFWTTNAHRVIGWHAKDGSRIVPAPAPGLNPFIQTIQRTPTFTDAIVALEGSIGNGYPVDPDPAVPGFKKLFQDVGAKGSHYVFVESDSGPGPATDLGRSLRHAKISAQNLLGLRGGTSAKHESSSSEESPFESEAEVG